MVDSLHKLLTLLGDGNPIAIGFAVVIGLSLGGMVLLLIFGKKESQDRKAEPVAIPEDVIRIGMTGRALSTLSPGGKIAIGDRRLDARCDGPPIPADTEVIVTGGDAFNLLVMPREPCRDPASLQNFGKPVLSFGERQELFREQDELAYAQDQADRHPGFHVYWKLAAIGTAFSSVLLVPMLGLLPGLQLACLLGPAAAGLVFLQQHLNLPW